MKMKLASGRVFAFLAALAAFAATHRAEAINYRWLGTTASDELYKYSTAANWLREDTSANAVPRTTSNAQDNLFFTTASGYIEDGASRTIYFDGKKTNYWKLHVRNAGSAADPIVFTASSGGGITAGANTSKTGAQGFLIAYDTGNAFLRIDSGTYDTGNYGYWYIGSTNFTGNVTANGGTTVSAKKSIDVVNGSLVLNGATMASSSTVHIGGYGMNKLGAPDTHAVLEMNGGSASSTSNTEIGNFSGSKTGGYALLSLKGDATYNCGNNIQMGAANGIAADQAWLAITNGTMNVKGSIYVNGGAGGIAIGPGGTLDITDTLFIADGGRGYASVGGDFAITLGTGGTLSTKFIRNRTSTAPQQVKFNFEGGTLKAKADSTDSIAFVTDASQLTVTVNDAGGIIDSNGKTITIPASLTAATGVATPGDITVKGGGSVEFTNDIGFGGNIVAQFGTTLKLNDTAVASLLDNDVLKIKPVVLQNGIHPTSAGDTLVQFTGSTVPTAAMLANIAVVYDDGTSATDYEIYVDGQNIKLRAKADPTWTAGSDGDFSTAANWQDDRLPSNGAIVHFAPTADVTANNDMTGLSVDKIVFDGPGAATITGNAITVTDTIVNNTAVKQFIAAEVTSSLSQPRLDGGPIAIDGTSSSAFFKANRIEVGTVANQPEDIFLAGENAQFGATGSYIRFGYGENTTGRIFADGGTISTTGNSGNFCLGGGAGATGEAHITNATLTVTGALAAPYGGTGSTGILDAKDCAISAKTFMVGGPSEGGSLADTTGKATINGGTVQTSGNTEIGCFKDSTTGGYALLSLNGGATFNCGNNLQLMAAAGSTLDRYYLAVTNATLNINGSVYQNGGTGEMSIGDGGTVNINGDWLATAWGARSTVAGDFTVRLGTGGTLAMKTITANAWSRNDDCNVTFAFEGGTVKATASNSAFLPDHSQLTVTVDAAGGIIDTQSYSCGLAADLGGTGNVTKTGSGTLTVYTDQTAGTGVFNVNEGTLAIPAGGLSMARGLSVASGATLSIASLDTATAAVTAPSFSFAAGSTVAVSASLMAKGEYKLFTLSEGTFAADAAANISVALPSSHTLKVEGDTIYLSVAHDYTVLSGVTTTSPTIRDDEHVTGAGGFNIASLELPATATLTFDPVKTPMYVYDSLVINEGFKFALSDNYASMTCGRIVLVTVRTSVTGLPETAEGLNALFDASTIAPGAEYAVTVEAAPDASNDRRQIVLTVGDYANAPEIRILPIGDSITQGVTRDDQGDYPQYRTSIAARLAASGYRPKMKGVWKFANFNAAHVQEPEDWTWHCGISGDRISTYRYSDTDMRGGVRDNLHLYLDVAGEMDVITLLIGTNDIGSGGEEATVTYGKFKPLVLDMAAKRPNAKIVVSTILQRNTVADGRYQRVAQFNELLKADIAAGDVYPANVILVDLFEQIDLDGEGNFFTDALHMNWAGCSLAAEGFAAKIMEALPLPAFTGTTDSTATDEPQTALGAAATVPAEYRAGMTHVFTIDAGPANAFGTAACAPYTTTNNVVSLEREVSKVGYYMELVREGSTRRRYVWVDYDATGKTLDQIDFPWTGDNIQFIAEKMHVYSNDGGISNVAANVDSVRGVIEGTYHSYTATDALADAPADIMTYGWNDSMGSGDAGFGCFQAHRIFSQEEGDTHWNDAQVLFAWNRWGSSTATDEIGIGDYACHANAVGNTMDYTHTVNKGTDGLPDTVGAGAYQVRHFEIWAVPVAPENPVHGKWIGGAGFDLSTSENWEDGQVPAEGDDIDFSGLTSATTLNADIDAKFGAVTMGSAVITFTNSFAAASFTDTSKIAVAADSTVTLDGNLEISGSDNAYIVNRVASGGSFVVTGRIIGTSGFTGGNIYQCASLGGGTVVAKGLQSDTGHATDDYTFRLIGGATGPVKWAIGADGITGTKNYFLKQNASSTAEIQPVDSDFAITTQIGNRANIVLNTTGTDGNGHKITIANGGSIVRDGTLTIEGSGRVVADYSNQGTTMPINILGSATLAVAPGADIGTGTIFASSGTTLAVPSTGTAEIRGNLTLAAGSALEFGFSGTAQTTLSLASGTTLSLPSSGVVNIKFASGAAPANGGEYTLISGGNLTEEDLEKFALPAGAEGSLRISEGNLVYNTSYFMILIVDGKEAAAEPRG